jgi:hypothetical protein
LKSRRLLHRERVHVRAQADHPAARVAPSLDEPDDAGAADPLDHLIAAEFGQLLRDEARRPPHFIHDLGMLMQVPAPFGYLRVHIG